MTKGSPRRPRQAATPWSAGTSTPHATRARFTAHVVRHTRATPAQLADYLAGFGARGLGAWPSQKHLAERFAVCVRTIQRWTRDLLAAGVLTVTRFDPYQDAHTGRWRRRTNQYRCRFKSRARPERRHHTRSDLGDMNVTSTSLIGELVPATPPVEHAPPSPPPWIVVGLTAAEWTRRNMGRL